MDIFISDHKMLVKLKGCFINTSFDLPFFDCKTWHMLEQHKQLVGKRADGKDRIRE